MKVERVIDFLLLPFRNLTPRARVLMLFRVITSLMMLICLSLLVALPYMTTHVYVARLSCSHSDVSNGLMSSLTQSVKEYGSSTLTTSEITILVSYVEEQVSTAPQLITSNLMNWCFGRYNSTETYDHTSAEFSQTSYHQVEMQCTNTDHNYVFDYRGELSTIGLNILLAYAYDEAYTSSSDSEVITSSTTQYTPDSAYLTTLTHRRRLNKIIVGLIFFTLAMHLFVLLFALLYYGNRGMRKDDNLMPNYIKQVFGVASLIAMICAFLFMILQAVMVKQIQSAVNSELGYFGLYVSHGSVWFGLGWTTCGIGFLSLTSWGGPIWCDSPAKQHIALQDEALISHPSIEEVSIVGDSQTYYDEDEDDDMSDDYIRIYNKPSKQPSVSRETRERNLATLLRTDDGNRDIVLNEDDDFVFGNGAMETVVSNAARESRHREEHHNMRNLVLAPHANTNSKLGANKQRQIL